MNGDSINVVSKLDFWDGGVDQRISGPSAAAPPLETKWSASHRDYECLDSITLKMMYKVEEHSKHSNICNKVETLVHSTG